MSHTFSPDDYGISCEKCGLPERHKHHTQPNTARDLDAARAGRDSGMAQAVNAQPIEAWRQQAQTTLRTLARSGQTFTADDLVQAVGLPHESEANTNNALGGLFGGAARAGLIERVGDTQSARIIGHARRIATWRGTRPTQ